MEQILKKVRKIEISTRHLVDGLIAGNYHSIFKGQGIEFSDIREYVAGDDVRAIDWNVTARFNHPFVKEFIEERDLRVYFALDISGSSEFGSNIMKKERAIEIVASLMFSAMKNNDNVGLVMFSDDIEKYIPARKGKKHVMKMLSNLLSHKAKSKNTDINKALMFISKVVKRRSIVFLISDLYSDDFTKPLRLLKKRHDVVVIDVSDRREFDVPDVGLIELEDPETGEQVLVDTSDKDFRRNLRRLVKERQRTSKRSLAKIGIDIIFIDTEKRYDVPLRNYFRRKKNARIR